MNQQGKVKRILWQELAGDELEALSGKLKGLYGRELDDSAFDSLAIDKQQALLLLSSRLKRLGLWNYVRRIENVYGLGGVGMSFTAWPGLKAELLGRRDFTQRFARHKDNAGGFLERGRRAAASLHFLYQDEGGKPKWAVHFDLYNPWSSPANAFRHLFYEKLKGLTPDWRTVARALSQLEK